MSEENDSLIIIDAQYEIVKDPSLPSIRKDDLRGLTHKEKKQKRKVVTHEIIGRFKLQPKEPGHPVMELVVGDSKQAQEKAQALREAGVHEGWITLSDKTRHLQSFYEMVDHIEETAEVEVPEVSRGANISKRDYVVTLQTAQKTNEKAMGILMSDINFEQSPDGDVNGMSNASTISICSRKINNTKRRLHAAKHKYDSSQRTAGMLSKMFGL